MNIQISGIDEVVEQLNQNKKDIKKKAREVCKRLVEEYGIPTAQSFFGSSIKLSAKRMPKGYALVGNGEAICFLEFGAGTTTDTSHPFSSLASFSVRPGSWSETHSQQFSKLGYWMFGGVKYTSIHPKRGMYNAQQEMIKAIPKVVSEVFSE